MKYFIITYGCQMNKSDSERIATTLENEGYKLASGSKGADLIVVNMCSVRQSAVDRVYGQSQKLAKLKTRNPKLKTLLTGCILKKDLQKFRKFFDFILAIKVLEKWPEFLKRERYFYYPNQRDALFNEKFDANYFRILPKFSNDFSAFIPISTGCNNFCTFCVVPITRGPLICRPDDDILKEVNLLVKRGVKEIWLLGQNVNDYHSPANSLIDFPKLLEKVNNVAGSFWIRFTSSHPKDFSDELIDIMANSQKITPYLNLPVQSGDDEILKKMNRPYTISQYKNLVKKIRTKIPDIALSTDIIVGFPGETKKQFENTVNLFKELKYDMAYIAKYSPRRQTTAFKLKDDISHKEKERRYKILTDVLKETALEKNQKYIGKEVNVLVEEQKENFWLGKTETHKTVKFRFFPKQNKISPGQADSKSRELVGRFLRVKISTVTPWGLKGLTKNNKYYKV
jgi:tRNA-2-methylthio-N6-dimethylallyladenosine synthase